MNLSQDWMHEVVHTCRHAPSASGKWFSAPEARLRSRDVFFVWWTFSPSLVIENHRKYSQLSVKHVGAKAYSVFFWPNNSSAPVLHSR